MHSFWVCNWVLHESRTEHVDILHLLNYWVNMKIFFIILFTRRFFPPFHTDLFLTLVVWSLFSMISSFAYSTKRQSSLCLENVLWFKRTLIYCFEIKTQKAQVVLLLFGLAIAKTGPLCIIVGLIPLFLVWSFYPGQDLGNRVWGENIVVAQRWTGIPFREARSLPGSFEDSFFFFFFVVWRKLETPEGDGENLLKLHTGIQLSSGLNPLRYRLRPSSS